MKSLHWGKGNNTRREARAAGSLDKAGRTARAINWRVCHDRSKLDAAAREKHLRSLLGLPAAQSSLLDDDEAAE
jgi:hypothetical protein